VNIGEGARRTRLSADENRGGHLAGGGTDESLTWMIQDHQKVLSNEASTCGGSKKSSSSIIRTKCSINCGTFGFAIGPTYPKRHSERQRRLACSSALLNWTHHLVQSQRDCQTRPSLRIWYRTLSCGVKRMFSNEKRRPHNPRARSQRFQSPYWLD